MAQPAIAYPEPAPPPARGDEFVVLRPATWADYQRCLEIRGERAVPRLTYLQGVLELMTPSHTHETIKSMIGCLVEAWCFENEVEITPSGSWTLESKESERGAEPDECYVLGDVAAPQRPDLAIEVIWTSGSLNKLEIYRKLGVQEVWIWRNRQLQVFTLGADENYTEIERSQLLPGIDLAQLLTFV
ncbi:MAG TPA: Uma2 family endonuclease, partial [Polyangiaceae bacterium]|nr:Uma2 family endonuclease [Polyangiaceae bacterium]